MIFSGVFKNKLYQYQFRGEFKKPLNSTLLLLQFSYTINI